LGIVETKCQISSRRQMHNRKIAKQTFIAWESIKNLEVKEKKSFLGDKIYFLDFNCTY